MGGKRFKKEKNKSGKIISIILLLIFISIMIFSGIKIIIWLKENNQSKDIIKNISSAVVVEKNEDNVDKYKINFANLKEINSDTVAWFKVNGTDIEYPIVKTNNNDYYMTHSFDKSSNSAGWVFANYTNKLDGSDKNIVIFGHNRRDGSMFGTLKNILTEEWQSNKDNYIIPFITEKGNEEYQVFSVYRIETEDYYITTNFRNDTEYENFIKTIKSRSVKDFNVDVTSDDEILTLSTCANDDRYRVVLHAKKVEK